MVSRPCPNRSGIAVSMYDFTESIPCACIFRACHGLNSKTVCTAVGEKVYCLIQFIVPVIFSSRAVHAAEYNICPFTCGKVCRVCAVTIGIGHIYPCIARTVPKIHGISSVCPFPSIVWHKMQLITFYDRFINIAVIVNDRYARRAYRA